MRKKKNKIAEGGVATLEAPEGTEDLDDSLEDEVSTPVEPAPVELPPAEPVTPAEPEQASYETPDGKTVRREFVAKEAASSQSVTAEECRALCKKVGIEYLNGYENRVVQFKYTDGTVDRYGDIIQAKGVDISKYKQNPVVLGFHDSSEFPIGVSLKVWYDKASDSVKGWVLFFDDRVDNSGFAETSFRMVKSGAVRTGSIGFIPTKFRRPTDDAERTKLGMGSMGYIYEAVELVEFSIVPIPANPSALSEPITKGFVTTQAARTLTGRKMVEGEEMRPVREALDALIAEAERVSREVSPAPTTPEIPVVVLGKKTPTLSLRLGRNISAENMDAIMKKVAEYSAQGIECSVVMEDETPPAPPAPAPAPELGQVLEALGKLRVGKVLSKRNKDKMTEVATHLVAAQVIIQELLDSSYVAGDDDDETEPPTKGVVSPKGAPVGAPAVDNSNPYDSEAFAMLTKATEQIQNLNKGK